MPHAKTDRQQQQPPVVQATAEASILSTSETALAAYLLMKGRALARIEDDPAEMVSFVFTGVEPGDPEAFRSGDLVPAIDFAKASQKVHQIIRARRVERHALRPSACESVPA